MRVRENVSRLSIHTVKTLLGNSKVGKLAPPPSSEKSALSSLLSRPRHLGISPHLFPVGKSPHRLPVGKSPHRHYPSPSRPWHHPPFKRRVPTSCFIYLIKNKNKNLLQEVHGCSLIWCWCWSRRVGFKYLWHSILLGIDDDFFWSFWER